MHPFSVAIIICICGILCNSSVGFKSSQLTSSLHHHCSNIGRLAGRPRLQFTTVEDPVQHFTWLEKIFFNRFASSVAKEVGRQKTKISTYKELIDTINLLSFQEPVKEVNERSKRMLVALFPPGLLPAYKVIFGPFQKFSEWMNTWVTWFATQWLMGPSVVKNLVLKEGDREVIAENRLLQIEKCRFLETSGCIQTCVNACKIPTQRFFYEEMGLPVTLRPNLTDYSCRFEFGVMPLAVEQDPSLLHPCLTTCASPCKGSCNTNP